MSCPLWPHCFVSRDASSCRFRVDQYTVTSSSLLWARHSDDHEKQPRSCWGQPCHSVARSQRFQQNGAHRQKTTSKKCTLQIEFGRAKRESLEAPAADLLREPESVHGRARSQQRGIRSVAGVSARVSGDVALPRDTVTPVGSLRTARPASTTLNRLQACRASDKLLLRECKRASVA